MIYLDHAATTRPHDDVVAAMETYYRRHYQNPSAQYAADAANGLAVAREQVASLVGAAPDEIVVTGGGSEADNLAIKGLLDDLDDGHVVTTTIEHPAIDASCRWLQQQGYDVTRVSPREDGRVAPAAIEDALHSETVLVSVMHANNETGVVQPLEEIAAIARDHDVLVHSDTVQTAGKLPIDVEALELDMASLSAHKFYGPKGVGALYIREDVRGEIEPLIHGGGQEGGLRSGTENVPGIVGMGVAADRALADLDERAERLSALRDEFVEAVQDRTGGQLVGHPDHRLPGYALFCFEGHDGSTLVSELAARDIAVSSGSACHSDTPSASDVLLEMGVDVEVALRAVRFSMGRHTTSDDVEETVKALEEILGATEP